MTKVIFKKQHKGTMCKNVRNKAQRTAQSKIKRFVPIFGLLGGLILLVASSLPFQFAQAEDQKALKNPTENSKILSLDEEQLDYISLNKIARKGFVELSKQNYEDAISALQIAAKHGHNAARWKLAQLYRDGIGVKKDDYKAFKMFLQIITQYKKFGFERVNRRQVSDAFESIGSYLKRGIPDSPIKINVGEANRLFHASAYFGNAEAQFKLGEYYANHPKEHPSYTQAARWLVKAHQKGHIKARALLGKLMFLGQGVELSPEFGLAMATHAMMRSVGKDQAWVENIYANLYEASNAQQRDIATAILEQDLLKTRKIKLRKGRKLQRADEGGQKRASSRIELRLGLKKAERQNKPDINELIFNRVLKK